MEARVLSMEEGGDMCPHPRPLGGTVHSTPLSWPSVFRGYTLQHIYIFNHYTPRRSMGLLYIYIYAYIGVVWGVNVGIYSI